jgi:hypothetical protein
VRAAVREALRICAIEDATRRHRSIATCRHLLNNCASHKSWANRKFTVRWRVDDAPGVFSQLFVKFMLFQKLWLGTKLEWFLLTPLTPSFANHHPNFDIAELGLPQRAWSWPRARTLMA